MGVKASHVMNLYDINLNELDDMTYENVHCALFNIDSWKSFERLKGILSVLGHKSINVHFIKLVEDLNHWEKPKINGNRHCDLVYAPMPIHNYDLIITTLKTIKNQTSYYQCREIAVWFVYNIPQLENKHEYDIVNTSFIFKQIKDKFSSISSEPELKRNNYLPLIYLPTSNKLVVDESKDSIEIDQPLYLPESTMVNTSIDTFTNETPTSKTKVITNDVAINSSIDHVMIKPIISPIDDHITKLFPNANINVIMEESD